MKTTTVGLDLAKTVFQVHGVNEHGKAMLKKQLKRDQVAAFFANMPPCLIGMEACASAHHWARKLRNLGHDVRLMAPQFVKPYVKTNKNDGPMPRRFVKRLRGKTCALWRSRASSNRPCCHCIACVRGL